MATTQPLDSDSDAASAHAGQYLEFTLAGRRFALPLAAVERGVRMVDITGLPNAPPAVRGIINVAGRIVPVIDVRRRFGLSGREVAASDHLLITRASAQASARTLALWVDAIEGVLEGVPVGMPAALPDDEAQYATGVIKLADGMVLVHDLDQFLSLDEARAIELVLSEMAGSQGDPP
jgi:purine-binding chemotaxis protein CheW